MAKKTKKTAKKKPAPKKAKPPETEPQVKYERKGPSKKQIRLALGAVTAVLFIAVAFHAISTQAVPFLGGDSEFLPMGDQPEPDWPVFTVINDASCSVCNSENIVSLMKASFGGITVREIDSGSPEAQELMSAMGTKALPAYIFNNKLVHEENFTDFAGAFNKVGENYVVDEGVRGLIVRYLTSPPVYGDPTIGSESAKATIIEYSDPTCPACKVFNLNTKPLIREKYGDSVRMVFKPMPLSQANLPAAIAFYCADEQGTFWDYMPLVYSGGVTDLTSPASGLGMDMEMFNECLNSGKYEGKVMDNRAEAFDYGVTGTPTIFINGIRLTGVPAWNDLSALIDAELAG